jgi:hypothetical protein
MTTFYRKLKCPHHIGLFFLVTNIPFGAVFIEVRLGVHFMVDELLG